MISSSCQEGKHFQLLFLLKVLLWVSVLWLALNYLPTVPPQAETP